MTEVATAALVALEASRNGTRAREIEYLFGFPQLFAAHPFPAIINTGFLRLADVYRAGSNDVRYQVLSVLRQCTGHLGQILNVDEVLRRFSGVLQSNDPVARALTLRVLGVIASLVAGHLEIQQHIHTSLEVPHALELEGAIFALDRCCQVSSSLSESVYDTIVFKIGAVETPLRAKLKLIHLLRHMHHEPRLATKAIQFVRKLREEYTLSEFAMVTMDTLTGLVSRYTQELPTQVAQLLQVMDVDVRTSVRLCALRNLLALVKLAPLTAEQVHTLFTLVAKVHEHPLQTRLLSVLIVHLARAGSPPVSLTMAEYEVLDLLSASKHVEVAVDAVMAQAVVLSRDHVVAGNREAQAKRELADRFLLATCAAIDMYPDRPNRLLAQAAHQVALSFKDAAPAAFEDFLAVWLRCRSPTAVRYIPQLLTRLARLTAPAAAVGLAKRVLQTATDTNNVALRLICVRLTLELLHSAGALSTDSDRSETVRRLEVACGDLDPAQAFDVGLAALLVGQHAVASTALDQLDVKVQTESFHYWLRCLSLYANAERALLGHGDHTQMDTDRPEATVVAQRLQAAILLLERSMSACEAVAACAGGRRFQLAYLELRSSFLRLLMTLLKHVHTLAEAQFAVLSARLAVQSAREMTRLGRGFRFLALSFFDIDERSYAQLDRMELICETIAYVLPRTVAVVVRSAAPELSSQEDFARTPAMSTRLRAARARTDASDELVGRLALVLQQIDRVNIADVQQLLLDTIGTPLELPAYFAQAHSRWNIDVTIEPAWKGTSSHWTMEDSRQILKIEGVLRWNERSTHRHKRTVSQVHVSVTTAPAPGGMSAAQYVRTQTADTFADRLVAAAPLQAALGEQVDVASGTSMHLMATPVDDYFRATCALTLASSPSESSSEYVVTIHIALEEAGTGRVFHTGPDLLLPIQVLKRPS